MEVFDLSESNDLPSASSCFATRDSGVASIRFARPSTTYIPAWPSLQFTCALPLGIVFQPFAEPENSQGIVPIVNSTCSEGPFRCVDCQGFVNPHFSWEEEGLKVRCNLCSRIRDVPSDYFSVINGFGARYDRCLRSELHLGSVDFLPPGDIVYTSGAPITIFLVDISYLSSSSGFLDTILDVLSVHVADLPLESEVSFILFDDCIHFVKFELSRNGSPSLISVSDTDDPFVPDPCLPVSPHLLLDQIHSLIGIIKSLSLRANPNRAASCANAALSVAVDLIIQTNEAGGGSVALFQASSSKMGLGRVDKPNNSINEFASEARRRCLEGNVCVDLFACSDSVVALGLETVSSLVHDLGGEQWLVNGSDLRAKLTSYIQKPKYYNCVMRVRASKAIAIESIDFGKRKGTDSISFPRLTSDSTIGTSFSVIETANHNDPLHVQLACLFTRADGTRLIRVHNVVLRPTPQAVKVFKHCDLDTVGFFIAKQAIVEHQDRPTKCSIKDSALRQIVAILHAYRVHCAVSSGSGQLILPDSLKALPLYVSGFLKQSGVRSRESHTSAIRDTDIVGFRQILRWTVRKAAFSCLVRMMQVYPCPSMELVPASRNKLYMNRIYLFDMDEVILFYVGKEVDPFVIQKLFGESVVVRLTDARRSPIMDVEPLVDGNEELANLLHAICYGRKNVRWKCILGSSSVGETKISNLLMEDRIGNESGYVDWLCVIHRLIQEKIEY